MKRLWIVLVVVRIFGFVVPGWMATRSSLKEVIA